MENVVITQDVPKDITLLKINKFILNIYKN